MLAIDNLSNTKLRNNLRSRIAFYTLGCKLNFSETSTISRDFDHDKYQHVNFNDFSDIYVINTCSVTQNADKKFKSLVSNVLKINDQAFVVAIGCYAQLQPEQLISIKGVDLVLGANEKFKLREYLNDISKNKNGVVHSCEIENVKSYSESFSLNERTRSFLKVQDGCDYKCSYCTIPKARGVSRSDSLVNVISNVKKIASNGNKEIVLTGVNIGDYGKGEKRDKNHEHSFYDMIKAIDVIDPIDRIRISSIEPNLLNDEIIEYVSQSNRFVPHFHIPLQSGSDDILKKMKRRYLTPQFKSRIVKIKKLMPDACIGVDVIVGFPGETDENFIETYDFIKDLPISYLHVFTYSERPGTKASLIKEVIPNKIRNKRSNLLRILSIKKRRAFYESQLGKVSSILFEAENKKGYIHGFSKNYIKVREPWNPNLVNQIKSVRLTKIDNDGFVRYENL